MSVLPAPAFCTMPQIHNIGEIMKLFCCTPVYWQNCSKVYDISGLSQLTSIKLSGASYSESPSGLHLSSVIVNE
jgi:hypothetical protein